MLNIFYIIFDIKYILPSSNRLSLLAKLADLETPLFRRNFHAILYCSRQKIIKIFEMTSTKSVHHFQFTFNIIHQDSTNVLPIYSKTNTAKKRIKQQKKKLFVSVQNRSTLFHIC